MSEELYASRDKNRTYSVEFWDKRPEWNSQSREYVHRNKYVQLIDALTCDANLIPQLEPGQLAKVKREVKDGVVTLTLGEIIESH